MEMSKSEYRTSDLALCAFLHLEGFGFKEIVRINEQRAEMVFEDGTELRDAVMDYQTGNASVEPREFQRKVGWVRGQLLDAVREQSAG
jgi:hypothetical protein